METIYLDTHIVIWLREKAFSKLSSKSKEFIEYADKVLISPMVILELNYLYEIERIIEKPNKIVSDLGEMIGLKVDTVNFFDVIQVAQELIWTRDAFDRLIVANAQLRHSVLITKDNRILDNYDGAVF
jgi:PIN domain nuclease of toxin-antitoxin system